MPITKSPVVGWPPNALAAAALVLLFGACDTERISSPAMVEPPAEILRTVAHVGFEVDPTTGAVTLQKIGQSGAEAGPQAALLPVTDEHLEVESVECDGCSDDALDNQSITVQFRVNDYEMTGLRFQRNDDGTPLVDCANCIVRWVLGPAANAGPGDPLRTVLTVDALGPGRFSVRFTLEARTLYPAGAPPYTVTLLPALPGGEARPEGINAAGDIVGSSAGHAVLWKEGAITDLHGAIQSAFPDAISSGAAAISDSGIIVGHYRPATGSLRAYRLEDGVATDLGTLGGAGSTQAMAINSSGWIVGAGSRVSGSSSGYSTSAFLWRDGVMTDLGTLGGRTAAAYGINQEGVIVGWSVTRSPGSALHAFLWQDGVMTDLDPSGRRSIAAAINDAGEVVGEYDPPGGRANAFHWNAGVMTDLMFDDPFSRATDINATGVIIGNGHSDISAFRAYVLEDGVSTSLPPLGRQRSATAVAVNAAGTIVGTSSNSTYDMEDKFTYPVYGVVWTKRGS